MSCARFGLPLVLSLLAAPECFAQSVVQLPVFNVFSVQTTVSVPDSGRGYLGGVRRARSGSTQRGVPLVGKLPLVGRPFRNRGIGSEMSTADAAVTARIIDLAEEEERQVGPAFARREVPAADAVAHQAADFLSRHVVRHEPLPVAAPERTGPSAAEIRRQNELAQRKAKVEALRHYADGQKAEAAGKKGAAKVYYSMASKQAKGDLKKEILARLDAIQSQKSPADPK